MGYLFETTGSSKSVHTKNGVVQIISNNLEEQGKAYAHTEQLRAFSKTKIKAREGTFQQENRPLNST